MSVQVENLEKNTAKLTIEVPAEKFEEAVQHSYNKNKGKFNIPGFRKGKAPFNMIKKMYGVGVFYASSVRKPVKWVQRPSSLHPRQLRRWNTWPWPDGRLLTC